MDLEPIFDKFWRAADNGSQLGQEKGRNLESALEPGKKTDKLLRQRIGPHNKKETLDAQGLERHNH